MKNAAIIGCGAIAPIHADGINDCSFVKLYAVSDVLPERAARFAKDYDCRYSINYKDILKDKNVDVVHICTPHFLHSEMAIESLKAGKDVILEKPLAISKLQALKVIEAEEKTGKRLTVCFQNRYNNTSLKLKEFLESGKGGKVLGAKGILNWYRGPEYYTESTWRGKWDTEGGGVLINQAIHTLDLLVYFLGDVKKVTGSVSTRIIGDIIEVENCAEGIIEFESGVNSLFYATSCYCKDAPIEIEIVCENALISLKDILTIKYHSGDEEKYFDNPVEIIGKNYWGCGHRKLIDEFYKSLESNAPPVLNAKEAMKALGIVLEFYKNRNQLSNNE